MAWLAGDDTRASPSTLFRKVTKVHEAPIDRPAILDQQNVARALADAQQLSGPHRQRREVERIAAWAAARDPLWALTIAKELPGRLQVAFRAALDGEWAHLDAVGYRRYVEANPEYLEALTGTDVRSLERAAGIQFLLASDPLSVFELADNLSSTLRDTLKRLALTAYAESDPVAALAFVAEMPLGENWNEAISTVATGYARVDAYAASQWIQSLPSQPSNAFSNVIRELARRDIGRAMELALHPVTATAYTQSALRAVMTQAASDNAQAAQAAEQLVLSDAPLRNNVLSRLLAAWAQGDVQSMLYWVEAHGTMLSPDILSETAASLASRDPVAAARYTDRIPLSLRASWISRTAAAYSLVDSEGALEWLGKYQGQPGYERGIQAVLASVARADASAAVDVFSALSPATQLAAAGNIAQAWAERQPIPAAEWALNLADPETRKTALVRAVEQWSVQDTAAAQDWILRLTPGPDRDQAIAALLRRQLMVNPAVTTGDPTIKRLIDQITNPATRTEVESLLQ